MAKKERGGAEEPVSQADRHARLVEELHWLRLRGIERIDSREHVHREFPELDRLLAASQFGDGVERPIAMRALIERALTYCKNGDALATLYGEVTDFVGATPDSLYKEAAEVAGVFGDKAVQRWVRSLRQELATALLAAEQAGIQPKAPRSESGAKRSERDLSLDLVATTPLVSHGPRLPRPLIQRNAELAWLDTTYRKLALSGGLFLLWGMSGTGKTVLARHLAEQVAREGEVGFLRVGRPGIFEEDIRHLLIREGHPAADWSERKCLSAFRRLSPNFSSVRLLVLDNITDMDELKTLMPYRSAVPILATSRGRLTERIADERILSPENVWRVGSFSNDEAAQFLSQRLPALSPKVASDLIDLMGGHPDTLDFAASYLKTAPATTAGELVGELARQPVQAVSDVAELAGVSSNFCLVVRRLLAEIEPASVAHSLLEAMAWADESGEWPRDVVLSLIRKIRGDAPAVLSIKAAIAQLERLGLVDQDDDEWLHISRLALYVIRDATMSVAQRVLLAFDALLDEALDPQSEQHSLLYYLRTLGQATPSTQQLLNELMGTPGCRMVMLDRLTWFFSYPAVSGRRVTLYRLVGGSFLRLDPDVDAWRPAGDARSYILLLVLGYLDEYYQTAQAQTRQELEYPFDRAVFGDAFKPSSEILASILDAKAPRRPEIDTSWAGEEDPD